MIKKLKLHLWIIPIIAIIISGWYLNKYYEEKGLDIEISFVDAKAISADKTKIYYRGIPVGIVKSMRISKNGDRAICVIELQKEAEQFAVRDTKFFLVSPQVGFEGISGLETLISGSYIAIEPGKSKTRQTSFEASPYKIENEQEENTTKYILKTAHAESVSSGDNIFYRGIVIGNVGKVRLNKTSDLVLIDVYIKNYQTKLIRENTVFWKKQGIKADLGLFGSDIKINSFDTILRGGIEIAIPSKVGIKAKAGHSFDLKDEEPKGATRWNTKIP